MVVEMKLSVGLVGNLKLTRGILQSRRGEGIMYLLMRMPGMLIKGMLLLRGLILWRY